MTHSTPKHPPIKSFVRHHGRLTDGQQYAIDHYWEKYGIAWQDSTLDFSSFGTFTNVVFEIGFGNGESLLEMAEKNPDTLFIGAEVHRPGIGRALMLAHEKSLDNLAIIEGDAVTFIDRMIADNVLDRVQIFFPDPWHKKRHFKRRLIQIGFCEKIQRILKPEGVLHIATDWQPYAKHCLKIINQLAYFDNVSLSNSYVEKPDYRPQTKFERRGIKLGHDVFDLCFKLTRPDE